jgi:hypothetical protein
LSVEGFHDRDALVVVAEETRRPLGVEGACVSVGVIVDEQGLVEVVRVAREERLPAASRASTAKV